jgi:hypothetical protein
VVLDGDHAFDGWANTVKAIGIDEGLHAAVFRAPARFISKICM